MPLYIAEGIGRYSGKPRRGYYDATDEAEAYDKAANDNLIVATMRLADDPDGPTERQREYARALGISIPTGATCDEVSELITAAEAVDLFPQLADLARRRRTARITYYKPGEDEWTTRTVEPYEVHVKTFNDHVTDGMRMKITQDRALIYCYQIAPFVIDGWRHFRLDRIKSVKDGGSRFRPRRPVTLHTGEAVPFERAID